MKEWHALVTLDIGLSEDEAMDLTAALAQRGASVSMGRATAGIALTAYGDDARQAANDAVEAAAAARPGVDVLGLAVQTHEQLEDELRQPLFPEVVGYSEIAAMAGVSRQRARAFTKIKGFPAPVIETSQGPLRARSAVAVWLETRKGTKSPREQHRDRLRAKGVSLESEEGVLDWVEQNSSDPGPYSRGIVVGADGTILGQTVPDVTTGQWWSLTPETLTTHGLLPHEYAGRPIGEALSAIAKKVGQAVYHLTPHDFTAA